MEVFAGLTRIKVRNAKYVLKFEATQSKGGILKAPKNGLMHREIEESITAEVSLTLSDSNENPIFNGGSHWVGTEVPGSVNELV